MKILFLFLMVLFSGIIFADELRLKSGERVEYQSIFAQDETGMTIEIEAGLRHIAWAELSPSDALALGYHPSATPANLPSKLEKEKMSLPFSQGVHSNQNPQPPSHSTQSLLLHQNLERSINSVKSESPSPEKSADSPSLDRLLDDGGIFLEMSPEKFMEKWKIHGFVWLSDQKQEQARSSEKNLTFLGLRVWEVIVRFQEGHFEEMTFWLYNRGDTGVWTKEGFESFVLSAEKKISTWMKKEPVPLEEATRTLGVRIKSEAWISPPYRLDMEWSVTRNKDFSFRPEYLRIKISKLDPSFNPQAPLITRNENPVQSLSFFDLKARVTRKENKDIFLSNIPMVDQGKKGYCAVATAERVFRYYGRQIDQHELAQLAQTSAEEGTTLKKMLASLIQLGREEDVKVRVHHELEGKDIKKLIDHYNKLAQKEKGHKIMPRDLMSAHELADIYDKMDAYLFKKVRMEDTTGFKKFETSITRYIHVGIPLLWSVVIGKMPETPPVKGSGAHMRLVIGYNPKTHEIIYTDSWGAGHEFKKMDFENAWSITTGLYTLEPRNWRYSDSGAREVEMEDATSQSPPHS